MAIEFDDTKDAANVVKILLALGAVVLDVCVGELIDSRRDYGEARVNAFGIVEGRLLVCTYTVRNGNRRIISVRRASRQEQRKWLS